MSEVLDDVLKAYCAAKIQREHILNQNGANLVYNHALDTAAKLGIGNQPIDTSTARLGITPFPTPVNTSNVSVTDSSNKSNKLGTAAQVAALVGSTLLGGAGGAGLMALASSYLAKPAITQPATDPTDSMGAVTIDVK